MIGRKIANKIIKNSPKCNPQTDSQTEKSIEIPTYILRSKDKNAADNETVNKVIEWFQKKNLVTNSKLLHLGDQESIFNVKYVSKVITEDQ